MAKFSGNKAPVRRPRGAVKTRAAVADTLTHEGGKGFTRDPKSELFLLAITNMVGENTFYESAGNRDSRFRTLIAEVVREDPEWIARFIPYLRDTMNMRSAAVVMAAEYAVTMRDLGQMDAATVIEKFPNYATAPSTRSVIRSALSRADEPAEFVGYWMERTGKITFPGGVQRGVADAVQKLYTEYSALKYDGQSRNIRMGDVLNLIHPPAREQWQGTLYEYLLGMRHKRDEVPTAGLPKIALARSLEAMPVEKRREFLSTPDASESLKNAGFTWERLSGWLSDGKGMDAQAWETIIPSMGIFALARNLRNFDQAGVGTDVYNYVASKLTDPDVIAKSRMFPYRFLTAYMMTGAKPWTDKRPANLFSGYGYTNQMYAVREHQPVSGSIRWAQPLSTALDLSLRNLPALDGDTLVLVDVSGSMSAAVSQNSLVARWMIGGLLGTAAAARFKGNTTLVAYGTRNKALSIPSGPAVSVLRAMEPLFDVVQSGELDHGTNTWQAVNAHYNGHKRVLIFTDEQSHPGSWTRPKDTTVFTWNLAGYSAAHAPSGQDGWYSFGGFSDQAFLMLDLLARNQNADWPF